MPLIPQPTQPDSIRKLRLSDLALACEGIVAKGGDDFLSFDEFRAALWAARIPLSTKTNGPVGHFIELADDDDLEIRNRDGKAVFIYSGGRCHRNPLASLKAVVESRLALMHRLGSIEHDADPVEDARIEALVDAAMKDDEATRTDLTTPIQ